MSLPAALADSAMPKAALADTQLPDPKQEAEAKALMESVRCLVCQGQSIADSEAEMAADMRAMIRERVQKGEKPEDIRHWLIARYGDWVSYKPVLDPVTAPLWLAPLLLIGVGAWLARGAIPAAREMTGWLTFLALALVAFGLLWRFGRVTGPARDLSLAVLFLAAAGYAWQGKPGLASVPREMHERAGVVDPEDANLRRQLNSAQFGNDAQWLDYSDALLRMGSPRLAVIAIKSGLKEHPQSADLWTGLGNALVAQGEGLVSPAAEFSYQRAASLAPDHPGPPFFYGLMLARSGNTKAAGEVWRGLLARAPDGAAWKTDLEARLAVIGESPTAPAKP